MLKGAGVQLVNFCLEPLTKHVECTSVCADNYSVANLISCHPTQQQLGFRVESFIRPPVHLFFYFLAPINIISVLVQPNLLEGMELRISVFGSTVTSLTQPEPHQMVLCGKGVMRTEGTVLALRNRTFERKHNIDLSSSDIVLGSHISPSDLLRQCEHSLKPVNNLRTLKLSITQFSGPKPVALKQVELWGTLGAATREEALAAHSVIANLRKPTNLVNEVSLFNSNPESCKVGHMCSGGASKSHKAAVMLPAHTGGREVCKSNNAQKTVYERKELPQYMTSLDFTTAEFPQNGKRVTGKGKANLQRPDNIASIQSTNPLCSSVPSSDYLRHGNLSMSHPSEISTGHQTNSSHCSLCVSPGKSCVRADGGRCEGSHGPSAVKGSSQGASCSSTVSATIPSRILVNQSYNGDRASENGGTGLDSISDQIGSGDDDDYMEIPEQFFDEITCEMMLLPMLLPSGHFVDRSTLEKLQHTDSIYGRAPSDPFTGVAFSKTTQPQFSVLLKQQIDVFLSKYKQLKPNSGHTLGSAQEIASHFAAGDSRVVTRMKRLRKTERLMEESSTPPAAKKQSLTHLHPTGALIGNGQMPIVGKGYRSSNPATSMHLAPNIVPAEPPHIVSSSKSSSNSSRIQLDTHEVELATSLDQELQNLFSTT